MNKVVTVVTVGLVGFFVSVSFFLFVTEFNKPTDLPSPYIENTPSGSTTITNSPKIVYGFLPFWLTKQFTMHRELTHLAYFSLTVTETGYILKKTGFSSDPGYRMFTSDEFITIKNQAEANGVAMDIVFTQFDTDTIKAFLGSSTAKQNFIATLDQFLSQHTYFSGVNLDFEYNGTPEQELQDSFTELVGQTHQLLTAKYPGTRISVDVYPSSIDRLTLWKLTALEPFVDHFVVMAYDFHRASSSKAGAVAPLLTQKADDKSIVHYIAQMNRVLPPEKLLLGVPFYGYQWQTVEPVPNSPTYPRTGSTASYSRILNLLADTQQHEQISNNWDPHTLSPFIVMQSNAKNSVISYEDPRSLGYKLELVNTSDMAGIAIWALGYEGTDTGFWDTIQQFFQLR